MPDEKEGVSLTMVLNMPVKKHISALKKQVERIDGAVAKLDNVCAGLDTGKEKEKEKDKDKVEEKRISKEDERKLQVGTPLVRCSEKDKPLSIAVKEFYEGKVKILGSTDENTSL